MVGNWCNSGNSHGRYRRIFSVSNYYGTTGYVPFNYLPVGSGSKVPIWRLLWRKMKREKIKKIFNIYPNSTPVKNFNYNSYTYALNFNEGSMWEDPDDLSRSFSARFAVPSSRIFKRMED